MAYPVMTDLSPQAGEVTIFGGFPAEHYGSCSEGHSQVHP